MSRLSEARPVIIWAASCCVALSPWAMTSLPMDNPSWALLFTPQNVFSALGIVGGVTLALYGKSPAKG